MEICFVCQDFEANVGHQTKWCPKIICQKCGQPGHVKLHCMIGFENMPLPNEVLFKILNFLNSKDLAKCSQVCTRFGNVVSEVSGNRMIQMKKLRDNRMMEMRKSLTLGALLTIYQGGNVVDPIFQLLEITPGVYPGDTSRSLMLNDGMYSNHATEFGPPPTIMLSREPYQTASEMATDQSLDEFCILKLKRFECITVDIIGRVHKGIIVHEVEILFQGSEVGQKIFGNTTAINFDGTVSENDQKAAKRMADEQLLGQPDPKKSHE